VALGGQASTEPGRAGRSAVMSHRIGRDSAAAEGQQLISKVESLTLVVVPGTNNGTSIANAVTGEDFDGR